MTIASEVKQCLANLKGIESSLSNLSTRSQDTETARTLHETMLMIGEIVQDINKRIGELESEEYQYKGF